MSRLRGTALGIWDFIAGDDWLSAAGVVVALGATAVISETSSGWWVMPIAVAALLAFSIWREARKHGRA